MYDKSEEIDSIVWNVYGKIERVVRMKKSDKSDLEFRYDAMGNRICKVVKPRAAGSGVMAQDAWTYTYYMRDASGNVIATYNRDYTAPVLGTYNDGFSLKENHLYGSSRAGIRTVDEMVSTVNYVYVSTNANGIFTGMFNSMASTVVSATNFNHELGRKAYELSNHLGNVLVTVSDARKGNNNPLAAPTVVASFSAVVLSAQDYYAFGSPLPGRTFNSNSYRQGFNGKELDTETSTYDYGFRVYNAALGRFLSVDPLCASYPWYTPYQFAGNKPIIAIDLDGLEEYIVVNVYDDKGKLESRSINYRTDANGIINQNYTSSDGVNHSGQQVLVNNRYRQADGSCTNVYAYQDALTAEQLAATKNAVSTPIEGQYSNLGGDKFTNVTAWQADIPIPPPLPKPKYHAGQTKVASVVDAPAVISTTGVTGGASVNDLSKPAYDGELAPMGRDYFTKLGKDVAKNPGSVTEINITYHFTIGDQYKGTGTPAGITLAAPVVTKEIKDAVVKGLGGANVKVNVTYDTTNVTNGSNGVSSNGATIIFK